MKRVVMITLAVAALLVPASGARAQDSAAQVSVDSVLAVVRRAQRLVNEGNGAEGRALLDTLLERTEPRSAAEAEALFWRATLAESWELAQRDYLRIMLEHERAPRAADAMLRLAQGELARGDREAALRFLERLAREAPESGARAEAGLWHGRLLIERGSRTEGCALLRATRGRVRSGALELENQYDYLLSGCPSETAAAPPPVSTPPTEPVASPPISTPPVAAPPQTTPPVQPAPSTPAPSAPSAPSGATMWSVQVGAFGTKAEADEFVAELRTLGWQARVDGTAAPFRVRFGRYATREEATRAMTDYRTRARADAFLTQVPRG
jgi:cell division septation protein DedD